MKILAGALEYGDGVSVARTVFLADTWWSRLRGLIGHSPLLPDEALWIVPCSQIHTHFMREPIDTVFLDADLRVATTIHAMPPWRISPWVRRASTVLEFSAGSMPALEPGRRLILRR